MTKLPHVIFYQIRTSTYKFFVNSQILYVPYLTKYESECFRGDCGRASGVESALGNDVLAHWVGLSVQPSKRGTGTVSDTQRRAFECEPLHHIFRAPAIGHMAQ
jgi:hypothetical protein